MKLDLDMSVFSRFFGRIVSEFGQKRLWPVAAVLLAAIVAVPLLLSSSSSPASSPQPPLPSVPPASGTSLPTINAQATPTVSHLSGSGRNPFGSSATGTGSATSSGVTSTGSGLTSSAGVGSTVTGASSTGSSTASTGTSGSGSSATSSTGSGSTTPPSITGNSKPKPAPTGLSSTQSYDVAMAITNAAGGVNTVDPLTRLGQIPNSQHPLLVELGVLKGGNRVLFAVQPGTVIDGPATCLPGPVDCELISLGQDQTEAVSGPGNSANALFAITGITAVSHPSAAAANAVRDAASARGKLLFDSDSSSLPALSLFKYESRVGSVVDLRNLTVEG